MTFERRRFLAAAGAAAAVLPFVRAAEADESQTLAAPFSSDWAAVRAQFSLTREYAHFASFLMAAHPRPVREAIDALRRGLDENPAEIIEAGLFTRPALVRTAIAKYLGGVADDVAITHCTTEGLALVWAGLRFSPGDELLTTNHDHFVQHEAIRLACARSGASSRRFALYDDPAAATEAEMARRLAAAITPATRAIGVTWVHSSTGVKTPLRRFASVVAEANRNRPAEEQVLLIVDGVHGIGVEDETIAETGVDFFAAGCHKWLFGPRGTGFVWGRGATAWQRVAGIVPSFEMETFMAWMQERDAGPTRGAGWVAPGGFSTFEHTWAIPSAFEFHQAIGRARIAQRIHDLNSRIKDGLAALPRVKVHTPRDVAVSAGLVCFEVDGMKADEVAKALHARKIVAAPSPYRTSYPRLAGSLVNTPEEVERAVAAVAALRPA